VRRRRAAVGGVLQGGVLCHRHRSARAVDRDSEGQGAASAALTAFVLGVGNFDQLNFVARAGVASQPQAGMRASGGAQRVAGAARAVRAIGRGVEQAGNVGRQDGRRVQPTCLVQRRRARHARFRRSVGAIVLEAEQAANVHLIRGNIAVAVSHRHHCRDHALTQVNRVVRVRLISVLQRQVLRQRHRAGVADYHTEGYTPGLTANPALDDPAVVVEVNRRAICGLQARIRARFNLQAERGAARTVRAIG